MKHLLLFMALVSLTACGPRYVDFFPCYDNGVPKPQVILLPLKSPADCPQGFSDAFVSELRTQLMDDGDVYLYSEAQVKPTLDKMAQVDFYGREVGWAKAFCPAEFAVVLETVEHCPYKYPRGCTLTYVLIKLRLKIIDLRQECPRIVASELIETCQRICPKGEESIYDLSVSSGAHRQLAKQVAERIEAVAWSVR